MRKPLIVAALVAGSLSFGAFGGATADVLPGGVEGCVVRNSPAGGGTVSVAPVGGNVYDTTCSFTATRTGGFVGAAQSWNVTVYNHNGPDRVAILNESGSGPACNTGAYTPGNVVVVTVSNGLVAAGNPFPSATDGTVTAGGDRCP